MTHRITRWACAVLALAIALPPPSLALAARPIGSKADATATVKVEVTRQLAAQCAQPTRQFSKEALRLGELATLEHRLFHGHEINAEGRLWHFGITETDNAPLDEEVRGRLGLSEQFAWQRILTYWDTGVGVTASPAFALQNAFANMGYPKAVEAARVPQASGQWLARVPRLAEQAAVANTPWSAAFISFLIRQVRLGPEFTYSEMHSVFIADALSSSLGPAEKARGFRVCDPARTRIDVGDLLCFTREDGQAPIRDFASLLSEVAQARDKAAPGARPSLPVFAAHCDVVSARDERSRLVQVIGGNAWQSVARRSLRVSAQGALDARYMIPAVEDEARTQACRGTDQCANLSRKRYVGLLKLR